MKIEDFKSHLSMLLRDQPIGTTADLSDFAVAWWNGHNVTYAFLRDVESGRIEEEFDLDGPSSRETGQRIQGMSPGLNWDGAHARKWLRFGGAPMCTG